MIEDVPIAKLIPRLPLKYSATALGVLILGLLATPVVGLWLAKEKALENSARLASLGMPIDMGASDLWEVVARTVALALVVACSALSVGTLLAWLEHRVDVPGRRLLALLVLLPLAIPSYLLAGAIQRAVEPDGLLGSIVPNSEPFLGFWPAALVLTIVTTPYVHLLVGAALTRIPGAEIEAARSLGLGRWSCFYQVVLPRLRPSLAFAFLLTTLYTISDFGCVSVLDCKVLTWRIYQAQAALQIVAAVDMGFGILALVVPLILLSRILHGRTTKERGVANPRPAPPIRPGPTMRIIAYALPLTMIIFGVIGPIVELCQWLLAGVERGEELASLSQPIRGTLLLATAGTITTLSLGFITAFLSSRIRKVSAILDGLIFLLSGLPGVLMAFGIALAALWLPPLLGFAPMRETLRATGTLVALGYAMRYLAEAHGVLTPTFLRVDERQREVARSLGAGTIRITLRVILPQIAAGIGAAGLLVFIALVKELPVTLLVAPLEIRTLAYRVWERYSEAFLADAAAAGLTLLGLTVLVQLLTMRWRHHA